MAREEAAKLLSEKAHENDLPLDYMLRVMRDPNTHPHRRDAMAKAAAPYLHPQLSAVAHRVANPDGSPIGPTIVHTYRELKTVEVERLPDVSTLKGNKH